MTIRFYAIIVLALTWFVLALFSPSPLNSDPLVVQRIMAAMGLCYLIVGVWTYKRKPNKTTLLFLTYCALSTLHWAGPIGVENPTISSMLFGSYIVLAAALFEGVFLHLSLSFPAVKLRKVLLVITYAPAVLGTLFGFFIFILDLNENLLLLIYNAGYLYGMLAGVIWLLRLLSGKIAAISRMARVLISASLILGWLPNFLATSGAIHLREYQSLSNLSLLLLLFAFSWMFVNFSISESD